MLGILEAPTLISTKYRDYLSFSALRTYQVCPLKYHFKYVLGLPEPTVAASLLTGIGFHAAVEAHYRALLAGGDLPGIDGLLDAFWTSWKARQATEVRFANGDSLESIGNLAERMLRAFLVSDLAVPRGNIVGIEEELRGPLVDGLPDLLARLDLIVDTPDAIEVTDFKTSRTSWDADQAANSADQLLLYSDMVQAMTDGKPVRLEFAVVTKTKAVSVTRHPVVYNQRQVDRTKRIIESVWHAIECEHFYPNPGIQCSTCPFRLPCAAWKG